MLDIKLIRESPEKVKSALEKKNLNPGLVDQFLGFDKEWRELTKKTDEARRSLNALSKERKIEEAKKVKEALKDLEAKRAGLERSRGELILKFPNIPFDDVPTGKDESKNKVLREVGKKPKHAGKAYLTIAEELDLIDVARAGKVAGSRFGYLKNEAVLLEFALVQLAINTLRKKGFIPVVPPVLIKPEIMIGMGKIKFIEDEDAFFIEKDKLYLAGSAEHAIGPMHADEVLEEKDLPRRYVGFSTCFRREAGSYGKDTRGILRVHQFDKVEMFSFTTPEQSEREHQFLLSLQEELMKKLKLPYRVVEICTGDMGFGDARQYDIETWIPSEGRYRETHSASNTTDYQARGLNIKYRPSTSYKLQTTSYVHALNATGFAIGRMIIAILENYQTEKGTVKIPAMLAKYAAVKEINSKKKQKRN